MSCVYGTFCGKAQSTYEDVLRAVLTKYEELAFYPDPTTVIYDFEKVSLQAVLNPPPLPVFGDHVQYIIIHLKQNTTSCTTSKTAYMSTALTLHKITDMNFENKTNGDRVASFTCVQTPVSKFQDAGLTNVYREKAEVKTFVGMIDELALSSSDRVSDGIDFLQATRDSLLVERRTRDRKAASSNPGRSGGRIFFSRINFVC